MFPSFLCQGELAQHSQSAHLLLCEEMSQLGACDWIELDMFGLQCHKMRTHIAAVILY